MEALRTRLRSFGLFFFNDTATTEIYTLSLHDALPIFTFTPVGQSFFCRASFSAAELDEDRKSTRLNSSHGYISYAVFCFKKKNLVTKGVKPGIFGGARVGHTFVVPAL